MKREIKICERHDDGKRYRKKEKNLEINEHGKEIWRKKTQREKWRKVTHSLTAPPLPKSLIIDHVICGRHSA